jgi:predicted phosphodiesterase
MSLADIETTLLATAAAQQPTHRRGEHQSGREYEWDGTCGWIKTEPLADRPKTWDEFVRDAGLDPDEVEIIEPVQVRGWDAPTGGGSVVRMRYYRLNVRRRSVTRADLDELVKVAKRKSPTTPSPVVGDAAFLVALGDLQLGKMDGDGVEGTVARYLDTTRQAVAHYRKVAKGAPVYLIHLGDCIEGMVSQGGANTWRTTLTTTEQVRLYRRLIIEQIKAFAAVAPEMTVVGIPGNHDEAHRPLHTYGDSWAIDSMAAVKDALDLAGTYGHVNVLAPARDELTLTLDVCGTIVGMAHGHQWRSGQATTWWAKQSHGRQSIGDADLLLSAHLHHLRIEHTGSDKTWIQVPALESGSQWWKHRTGEWGQPGVLTALVGGGSWSALEVLS